MENLEQFENRKKDHIRIALDASAQATEGNRFDQITLTHEALPELNLNEVSIDSEFNGTATSPFFISSMTAGHTDGVSLNESLARAAQEKNWLMGVGSQRRQLFDESARAEWKQVRKAAPKVNFIGNIGVSQLIESSSDQIKALVDSLEAVALFVHTNPIQEAFQPEGTPSFRGGLESLQRIASDLSIPVILKETGSGFSKSTLENLNGKGLYAVDVAGLGGTHWGRVEGARSKTGSLYQQAAETFANWGVSTVDSVLEAKNTTRDYRIWASGGVRNGLDAAKLLAMGAEKVGFAKVIIESALKGVDPLLERMTVLEYELQVALFCTGCKDIQTLQDRKVWSWKKH